MINILCSLPHKFFPERYDNLTGSCSNNNNEAFDNTLYYVFSIDLTILFLIFTVLSFLIKRYHHGSLENMINASIFSRLEVSWKRSVIYLVVVYGTFVLKPCVYFVNLGIKDVGWYIPSVVNSLLGAYYYWLCLFYLIFFGIKYQYMMNKGVMSIPDEERPGALKFSMKKAMIFSVTYFVIRLSMDITTSQELTLSPDNIPTSGYFFVFSFMSSVFYLYYAFQRISFLHRVKSFKTVSQLTNIKKGKELAYQNHLRTIEQLPSIYNAFLKRVNVSDITGSLHGDDDAYIRYKEKCSKYMDELLESMQDEYIKELDIIQNSGNFIGFQLNTRELHFLSTSLVLTTIVTSSLNTIGYGLAAILEPSSPSSSPWYAMLPFISYLLECTLQNWLIFQIMDSNRSYGLDNEGLTITVPPSSDISVHNQSIIHDGNRVNSELDEPLLN